jgi:hypothetical protein
MKGNGYYHIGRGGFGKRSELLPGEEPEGTAELHPAVVFQAVDELPDRTVKQGRGPGRGEAWRLNDAAATEVIVLAGCKKRDPAYFT